MSLIIRPAQPGDGEGIARVRVAGWQCAYRGKLPDALLDSLSIAENTERWERIVEKSDLEKPLFVAISEGVIVGFCGVRPAKEADVAGYGELGTIYVDPQFQGQGIGTALMNTGLDVLRKKGFKNAILWVLPTNTNTIAFYEKHGWRADGATREEVSLDDGVTPLPEARYRIAL